MATHLKGIFTISLDFELHWGGFEKWHLPDYQTYFKNTRAIIPEMLRLFEQYEVHVTWATVGMLFHNNREELTANMPARKPEYALPQLSAYHYIRHKGIGQSEADDPFHYAPSLVSKILSTPHQEIGSHTFAHYYCNEAGQDLEVFRDDLKAAQRVAAKFGVKLSSLVFPRNQFNDRYLKVCSDEGITSVRSNPLDWFWNIQSTVNESAWKRLNRGLDAYVEIGKKNTFPLAALQRIPGLPVCIPASRLLRPYNPNELFLNSMKISRICGEMKRAAGSGEVYHLWWHPHNFGNYPEQSLEGLVKILEQYAWCRDRWKMTSLSMNEISARVA